MVIFTVLFTLFSLIYTSIFTFPLFSSMFLFLFLYFSNFSLNSFYLDSFFVFDELSLFMTYMTLFVMFISFLFIPFLSSTVNVVFFVMFLFCFLVFFTNNIFVLYLSYESSLLPILFIIIKWGSYPERSLSALMLLIYTSIFTFPFIYVMFYIFSFSGSLNFFIVDSMNLTFLSSIIIFFTFAVKLPIYGLHFWLPMAHVEAPTFGSMILAGILLKLGGLGLIRFSSIMNLFLLKSTLLAYLMVFLVFSTLVCCFQSDFKRLIAYSSVSHMMAVPLMLLANNVVSIKAIVLLMFFHGLSSPVLFMLVGLTYSMYGTRQILSIRGLVLISPLLSFIFILAFFFTLSAPPFPSFISEVLFMLSTLSLSYYLVYSFLAFAFFSLVYNLNWLSSLIFSSTSKNILMSSAFLSYKQFLPLISSFILAFNISFLTMFL